MAILEKKGGDIKALRLIIAIIFFCSGCCSLTKGITQGIVIESIPDGAEVIVGNGDAKTTPVKVRLLRRKTHIVEIRKEGYKTERIPISNKEEDHDKGLWGNLFLGCLIFGAIIDMITGACHCLNPQYRNERMELYYHYNTFKAMRVTLEKEG